MNTTVSIVHSETDGGGQYRASVADSDATGLLTYRRRDSQTIVADHTLVPDALRGRGIASALVKRLIDDARDQDFRIVPECSFVRAAFDRHPDWDDVKAN